MAIAVVDSVAVSGVQHLNRVCQFEVLLTLVTAKVHPRVDFEQQFRHAVTARWIVYRQLVHSKKVGHLREGDTADDGNGGRVDPSQQQTDKHECIRWTVEQ